ncbi:hypothetical protein DFH09DRAFT_1084815 [Mycena vulgaris]|nr:hypothetical protein DFH09DRAFT_1084815 [Mycena vulgaris]
MCSRGLPWFSFILCALVLRRDAPPPEVLPSDTTPRACDWRHWGRIASQNEGTEDKTEPWKPSRTNGGGVYSQSGDEVHSVEMKGQFGTFFREFIMPSSPAVQALLKNDIIYNHIGKRYAAKFLRVQSPPESQRGRAYLVFRHIEGEMSPQRMIC